MNFPRVEPVTHVAKPVVWVKRPVSQPQQQQGRIDFYA